MSRPGAPAVDPCPDWDRLVARRGDSGGSLGGDWERALEHLDGGCGACRRRALAADPLLAFRRLPAARPDAGEIDSMKVAVRALRRNRELGAAPRRAAGVGRLAAAACLLALLGLALGGDRPEAPTPAGGAAATGPPTPALPLVEELDRPGARVYQLRQEDLAVVMIVDETLDV